MRVTNRATYELYESIDVEEDPWWMRLFYVRGDSTWACVGVQVTSRAQKYADCFDPLRDALVVSATGTSLTNTVARMLNAQIPSENDIYHSPLLLRGARLLENSDLADNMEQAAREQYRSALVITVPNQFEGSRLATISSRLGFTKCDIQSAEAAAVWKKEIY